MGSNSEFWGCLAFWVFFREGLRWSGQGLVAGCHAHSTYSFFSCCLLFALWCQWCSTVALYEAQSSSGILMVTHWLKANRSVFSVWFEVNQHFLYEIRFVCCNLQSIIGGDERLKKAEPCPHYDSHIPALLPQIFFMLYCERHLVHLQVKNRKKNCHSGLGDPPGFLKGPIR